MYPVKVEGLSLQHRQERVHLFLSSLPRFLLSFLPSLPSENKSYLAYRWVWQASPGDDIGCLLSSGCWSPWSPGHLPPPQAEIEEKEEALVSLLQRSLLRPPGAVSAPLASQSLSIIPRMPFGAEERPGVWPALWRLPLLPDRLTISISWSHTASLRLTGSCFFFFLNLSIMPVLGDVSSFSHPFPLFSTWVSSLCLSYLIYLERKWGWREKAVTFNGRDSEAKLHGVKS